MCSTLSDAEFLFMEKSKIKAFLTEKHKDKPTWSAAEAN